MKRGREEKDNAEAMLESEMRRLAEDGKRRRREMEERLKAQVDVKVTSSAPMETASSTTSVPIPAAEALEEDEVALLERRIAEAKAAKARQKAEKRARKSGVLTPAATERKTPVRKGGGEATEKSKWDMPEDKKASSTTSIPTQRPDIFKGLKADKSSASSSLPKFSFSPPSAPKTSSQTDFAATMARLKAAEKARLEEEIIEN